MEMYEVEDIWRTKNPNLKSFTWGHSGKNQFSRIDLWLTSTSLQDSVSRVDIINGVKSDHSAIVLNLKKDTSEKRGPGFWKFNSSLLEDKKYVSEVEQMIADLGTSRQTKLQDPSSFWEWLKYNVRKHAMKYSKMKAYSKRKEEEDIQRELLAAKKTHEEAPSQEHLEVVKKLQKQLDDLYERKAEGVIIRAKVKWYEYGEKNSKYFLNLEKRNV